MDGISVLQGALNVESNTQSWCSASTFSVPLALVGSSSACAMAKRRCLSNAQAIVGGTFVLFFFQRISCGFWNVTCFARKKEHLQKSDKSDPLQKGPFHLSLSLIFWILETEVISLLTLMTWKKIGSHKHHQELLLAGRKLHFEDRFKEEMNSKVEQLLH